MMDKLHCPECGLHIDEHPAGRCLDAWVITSLGIPKPIYTHSFHLEPIYDETGFWYCQPIYEHGDVCEWHPITVSKTIAAAWGVVEKLTDKGYCPAILFDDNGHWAMSMEGIQSVPMTDEPVGIATMFFVNKNEWDDDVCLAICRAAIKATA